MTTNAHTPITVGAAANAATFNAPLGQLDAALSTVSAELSTLALAGGNVATLKSGAVTGGTSLVVDATTGFIAGGRVAYVLSTGVIEYNTVSAVPGGTTLTVGSTIGGTIADNTLITMVSEAEYQRAQAVDFTGAAFVDVDGDDATAKLGRSDKPFATINAALDALGANGGRVFIGMGTFAPVTRSKIMDYTKFYGSGRPTSYGNTHLGGSGTVIQGPFTHFKNGIELHDLGIDSGPNVCTALYGGVAQEGIVVGEVTPVDGHLVIGIVLSNVAAMCQSASAAVHAMLLESVTGATGNNLTTYYGIHGISIKALHSTFTNLQSYGSANDNVIIKCDATSECHDVSINGLAMKPITAGDAGGLLLSSNRAAGLYNISVNGATAYGTNYGVTFERTAGTFANIAVGMEIYAPVYGTVNLAAVAVTDGVLLNGAPVALNLVGGSGQPAFQNSWNNLGIGNAVASFYKSQGRVWLCGAITGGTSLSIAFTLPAGYRPAANVRWSCTTGNAAGGPANISIGPSGEVYYEVGPNSTWVMLDGSFFVGV